MWNKNIIQGNVWSVKSLNVYDEEYTGMAHGEHLVLILSVYRDINAIMKFTYLKIEYRPNFKFSNIKTINRLKKEYYINLDNIYTGDVRALNEYQFNLKSYEIQDILKTIKCNFNFIKKIKKSELKIEKQKLKVNELNTLINMVDKYTRPETYIDEERPTYEHIKKFNLDISFSPSEHIKLDKNNKFVLSTQFKNDLVGNKSSKELSEEYLVFPEKAINQMRSRMRYRYKQKQRKSK